MILLAAGMTTHRSSSGFRVWVEFRISRNFLARPKFSIGVVRLSHSHPSATVAAILCSLSTTRLGTGQIALRRPHCSLPLSRCLFIIFSLWPEVLGRRPPAFPRRISNDANQHRDQQANASTGEV